MLSLNSQDRLSSCSLELSALDFLSEYYLVEIEHFPSFRKDKLCTEDHGKKLLEQFTIGHVLFGKTQCQIAEEENMSVVARYDLSRATVPCNRSETLLDRNPQSKEEPEATGRQMMVPNSYKQFVLGNLKSK